MWRLLRAFNIAPGPDHGAAEGEGGRSEGFLADFIANLADIALTCLGFDRIFDHTVASLLKRKSSVQLQDKEIEGTMDGHSFANRLTAEFVECVRSS